MSNLNSPEGNDLPSYDQATIPAYSPPAPPPKRTSREYLFYRGNGLTSNAKICSSDRNRSHTLRADISSSRPSTISIHLASTKSPLLGSLRFPATHNDFQIHLPPPNSNPNSRNNNDNPDPTSPPRNNTLLIQVKARIGNPHPTTYHFVLPPSPAPPVSQPRKVVWTIRHRHSTSSSASKSSQTISYTLTDETTNEPLAFWTTVPDSKHAALLRWHVLPRSELEEFIVMMSFIGCMSRLRLKGKEHLDGGSGLVRWNGLWFGAVLGTAAVA